MENQDRFVEAATNEFPPGQPGPTLFRRAKYSGRCFSIQVRSGPEIVEAEMNLGMLFKVLDEGR